jgi:taurine transport system substrate-binding protein
MKLRPLTLLAIGVALLFATALAGCGASDDASGGDEPLKTLTVGHYTLGNPYGMAIENGWFKEEFGDTEVKFVELDGTANALAGLASGDLNIALIGTPGAATALSQGLDIKVPWIYEVIDTAEALVVRADKRVSGPEDLKGLTLATPFGSTAHYAILQYLNVNEMSEADVTLVDLAGGDLTAAFSRGDIDGAWINEPAVTELLKAGGEKVADTGDLVGDGVVVADIAAVNGKFAGEHPEMVKKYMRVLDRATQAFNADPDGSYPTMAKYLGLTEDETRAIMEGYQFLPAEQQGDEQWLGGRLAKSIHDNAVIWEDQDRVPKAASEDATKAAVVTDFLDPWTGQ